MTSVSSQHLDAPRAQSSVCCRDRSRGCVEAIPKPPHASAAPTCHAELHVPAENMRGNIGMTQTSAACDPADGARAAISRGGPEWRDNFTTTTAPTCPPLVDTFRVLQLLWLRWPLAYLCCIAPARVIHFPGNLPVAAPDSRLGVVPPAPRFCSISLTGQTQPSPSSLGRPGLELHWQYHDGAARPPRSYYEHVPED